MEFFTPEQKKQEKKLYKTLYGILIVLPVLALLTIFGYTQSQITIAQNATEAIQAGDVDLAKEWASQLDSMEQHNRNRETVLMVACESGVAEMVEWAIAHDADPNYAPRGAMTPLELYCSFGFRAGAPTLNRLLRAGARVNNYLLTPPIFCLGTKLIWMTAEEREIAFDEMLLLYKSGDKMQYNGVTLFHYAARYDNEPLAYELLCSVAGAKQLAMEDPDGYTPYELALQNGSSAIQRLVRRFEEGLLAEQESTPIETTKPEDNKDELDALINSLQEQASQKQEISEEPESTEDIDITD